MLLQLFVVLLASSLVEPSAININILPDEKSQEGSLTTCIDNSCEAICKKFGYKDGLCSDGQCKCLYYTRAKHHTEEARSQNDCDDLACYMTCMGGGSIGGTCIGDFCYCYTFKPLKELKPKAVYSLRDSCKIRACDQLCRNLGLTGGACVGDRCDCDNFKPLQEFLHLITPMKSIEHENSGKHHKITKDIGEPKKTDDACDFGTCNDLCQRSNYIGGLCIGGSCYCY